MDTSFLADAEGVLLRAAQGLAPCAEEEHALTEKRKTADELKHGLQRAIEQLLGANVRLDYAREEERKARYDLGQAIIAIEQRMLEVPVPSPSGGQESK